MPTRFEPVVELSKLEPVVPSRLLTAEVVEEAVVPVVVVVPVVPRPQEASVRLAATMAAKEQIFFIIV